MRLAVLGLEGLIDCSSRPLRTRITMNTELTQRIGRLRRKRLPKCRIAQVVDRSVVTISRVLEQICLSILNAIDPKESVVRYEHEVPDGLLHMKIKAQTYRCG